MMYSDHLLRDMAEQRMQDWMREAETERMLRQAGLRRDTISMRLARALLGRLGYLLVTVGERLQGHAAPLQETSLSAGKC